MSKDYFDVFTCKIIQGEKKQALANKDAVLLSEELATKLFNTTQDIIGKSIEWNREGFNGRYFVSGIFASPPSNATSQFDLIFSYDSFLEKRPNSRSWASSDPSTYVLLKEGVSINHFNDKIDDLIEKKVGDKSRKLFAIPFSDKYLYGAYENGKQVAGRIEYVKLFSIIAIFILLIACINFMNLSTAKAAGRVKELGIKKTIGASRFDLIKQYTSESLLMAFMSLIVAIILAELLLPQFNSITGKQLFISLNLPMILSCLGITVITGLIAGSYPALYLSGFKPATVLKGKQNNSLGELWTRKGLVVFQFSVSVILIVSVLVVYLQIEFVQNKSLGYNKENIIYFESEGTLDESLLTFLEEVRKIPGVVNASNMHGNLTGQHGNISTFDWEGKNPDDRMEFGNLEVGYDWIQTVGVEIKEGRTFSKSFGTESSSIIFNEAAIETMGIKDPIGKTIKGWGEEKQIVGVVKDFHFESLYEKVKPSCFLLFPYGKNVMVKIRAGNEEESIHQLGKLYQKYNAGLPFDYKFLDAEYQALYQAEQRVSNLSKYFAGLAILISCLGLFGLAAFTAERRSKEIGIRKILGSSDFGIVYLLSSDFTKMVIISIAIALPVSYFTSAKWLESFAYRIDLGWWYFVGAGFIALFVAWFTVGLQTVKAARVNPVKCLQDE